MLIILTNYGSVILHISKQIQVGFIIHLLLMCSHEQLLDGKHQLLWIQIWSWTYLSKRSMLKPCQRTWFTTIWGDCSAKGAHYLSIRSSNRLEAANLPASVGITGDSYDNALPKTLNGLYKTEIIEYLEADWQNLAAIQPVILNWVDWFNKERVHSALVMYHLFILKQCTMIKLIR